jgi:hypothetical protein
MSETETQNRLPKKKSTARGRIDPPRQSVFVEPKTKGRIDPPVQHVDAVTPWSLLQNKDPSRWYVFAHATSEQPGGMQWYKLLGYRVEKFDPNSGVVPMGGLDLEPGDPIRVLSCVLMSCSLERKRELDQRGFDGASGQELVDEREQLIVGTKGLDASRGLYGRFDKDIFVENETEPDWKPVGEGAGA